MSFLAPFFLLGGLALGLPVLFHLIRRTTRERTLFSSLMFLEPTPPRLTRKSRLEHLLLLLLRCVVLALLALGFARPFLKNASAPPAAPGEARRLVVLVDTSASMRRDGLWTEARARVERVLRETTPNDEVALLTFDREVTPVFRFDEWKSAGAGERVALALARFESRSPSWAGTQLGLALSRAAETLAEAEADGHPGRRRVVLISDLQEGSRLEALQAYDWPKNVEVQIESLKPRTLGNAGLQWVAEGTGVATAEEANVRVRVVNSPDATGEKLQVGWARPDAVGFAGTPIDVYVPPGQSRVVPVPVPPGATNLNRILLRGDAADFDNTVHVQPPETARSQVLYLGADAAEAPRQPLYFLRRAFPETRRQSVRIVARPPTAALTADEVASAALVVVTEALSTERVSVLRAQLEAGRTILVAPRDVRAGATLAGLLGVADVSLTEAPGARYAMFGELDFQHPLLAPFADARFSDFTKIHFWKHRRLSLDAITGARVIARFDAGDPALVEVPVGRGRVVILTSCWHPEDSQLALSTKFVPLLFALLELAGGAPAALTQHLIGDVIPLPGLTAGSKLLTPEGTTVDLAPGTTNFAGARLPGLYVVTSPGHTQRFAVNVDPMESRTAPVALDDLERLGAKVAQPDGVPARQVQQRQALLQSQEAEARQKLWRWFLIAALGLLLVETGVAGWFARRTPLPEGATA